MEATKMSLRYVASFPLDQYLRFFAAVRIGSRKAVRRNGIREICVTLLPFLFTTPVLHTLMETMFKGHQAWLNATHFGQDVARVDTSFAHLSRAFREPFARNRKKWKNERHLSSWHGHIHGNTNKQLGLTQWQVVFLLFLTYTTLL